MSILQKDNYYQNWHKPAYFFKAKKKKLSELYPVSIHHTSMGANLTFEDEEGYQITFFLSNQTLDLLKDRINHRK